MSKISTNKIIDAMKEAAKVAKSKPVSVPVKPKNTDRDMRQEAIDIGSHGAKEYFGETGVSNK